MEKFAICGIINKKHDWTTAMKKQLIEGKNHFPACTVTLSKCSDGFMIDRVEVPEKYRGKGVMAHTLKTVVDMAIEMKVNLHANIMADNHDDYTEMKIVNICSHLGFKPLKMDGEVYRKDVSFEFKKHKPKAPVISPALALILSRLNSFDFSDKIKIFGSLSKTTANPKDIDLFLDMDASDPGFSRASKILLTLSKKYYGSIDPFIMSIVSGENTLMCRNDYASQWQVAKNSKDILSAIADGISLNDVISNYRIKVVDLEFNNDEFSM